MGPPGLGQLYVVAVDGQPGSVAAGSARRPRAFYLFYSSLPFSSRSAEQISEWVGVLGVVEGVHRPRGRGAAGAALRPRYQGPTGEARGRVAAVSALRPLEGSTARGRSSDEAQSTIREKTVMKATNRHYYLVIYASLDF